MEDVVYGGKGGREGYRTREYGISLGSLESRSGISTNVVGTRVGFDKASR